MSNTASIVTTGIGIGAMAWGFAGVAQSSTITWTATWLDAAWISMGIVISCIGGYALGSGLREDPA